LIWGKGKSVQFLEKIGAPGGFGGEENLGEGFSPKKEGEGINQGGFSPQYGVAPNFLFFSQGGGLKNPAQRGVSFEGPKGFNIIEKPFLKEEGGGSQKRKKGVPHNRRRGSFYKKFLSRGKICMRWVGPKYKC